jgi:hypothetical protein
MPSFLGATLVAGLACAVPVLLQIRMFTELYWCLGVLMFAVLAKLAWEYQIRYAKPRWTPERSTTLDDRSRRLARTQLAWLSRLRLVGGLAVIPSAVLTVCSAHSGFQGVALCCAIAVAAVVVLSEFCERLIYFASVVTPRMPGTLR